MIDTKANTLFWVGSLQDPGIPYAELYLDRATNSLYLLVRVSKTNDSEIRYAAIEVTSNMVSDYMENRKPIADVFSNRPFRYATVSDKSVWFDDVEHTSSPSTFQFNTVFNPQLSVNRVKMKMLVNRMNRNGL